MLKEVAEKRLAGDQGIHRSGKWFQDCHARSGDPRSRQSAWDERQHGHMEAVGYDLYCKMLNEAVQDI